MAETKETRQPSFESPAKTQKLAKKDHQQHSWSTRNEFTLDLLNKDELLVLLDTLPVKELLAFEGTNLAFSSLVNHVLKHKRDIVIRYWIYGRLTKSEVESGIKKLLLRCQSLRSVSFMYRPNNPCHSALNELLRDEQFSKEFAIRCPLIEDFGYRLQGCSEPLATFTSYFNRDCRLRQFQLFPNEASEVMWQSCSRVQDVLLFVFGDKDFNWVWDEAKFASLKKIHMFLTTVSRLNDLLTGLDSMLKRYPQIDVTLELQSGNFISNEPLDRSVLQMVRRFCKLNPTAKLKLSVRSMDIKVVAEELGPVISSFQCNWDFVEEHYSCIDEKWSKLAILHIKSPRAFFAYLSSHCPPNLTELNWSESSRATGIKDFKLFASKQGSKMTKLALEFNGKAYKSLAQEIARFENLKYLDFWLSSLTLTAQIRSSVKYYLKSLKLKTFLLNDEKMVLS